VHIKVNLVIVLLFLGLGRFNYYFNIFLMII
jgi:hypothetical protein